MTRQEAAQFARDELNRHNLSTWGVRINPAGDSPFLGLCSYKDRCIILSGYHIDMHPTDSVKNTIRHEIAHALTPGQAHNDVWRDKAREIGCDNTSPCSNLSLNSDVIDAIRSGATVEVTFEEEIIRHPRYKITRLQDKCPHCGKIAKTLRESTIHDPNPDKPDQKYIFLECGHLVVKNIPKGTPFHTLQMGGDPNCNHEWNKNKCMKCGRFRPYQFQIEGMRFLEMGLSINKGAACFDEMGLGKTIQTGFLKFHPEWLPAVIFATNSSRYQWVKFLVNWLGDEFVPQLIKTSNDILIPGLKFYICGYDMIVPKIRKNKKTGKDIVSGFDIQKFIDRGIKTVVLDECQKIKNVDSSRTQMVRRVVKNTKVVPLSGTPWNNRGSELFPVFNMMDPYKFSSEEGFKQKWVARHWVGNRLVEGGIKNVKLFRDFTKDIAIRRERLEVLPELPTVNRTKIYIPLNELEEKMYDEAVGEFVTWYEQEEANTSGMSIIGKMQRMRHIVALAKLPYTESYVDEFVEETDRKLVVFVHHKDVHAILYNNLREKVNSSDKELAALYQGIPILQLVAEQNAEQRAAIQDQFNQSKRAILIASEFVAGEAINLQTGSDCVMHERQWNPGNEEQAEGRFIRIGQEAKSVSAAYAEAEMTIDQQMDAIVERKRLQFHEAMNRGEMPVWSEAGLAKELAEAVVNAYRQKKGKGRAA